MSAFFKNLWGHTVDKAVELLLSIGPLIAILVRADFSYHKIVESRFESLAILWTSLCGLVTYHAFRSAYSLSEEIKEQEKPFGFTSSDSGIRFASLKLYGIAVSILIVCLVGVVAVWRLVPKDNPFSVVIEDRIFSQGGNVPTHFRILQQNSDGSCNLRRVDVIFFFRITNLQKTDAMISAYNIGFGKGEYLRINMLASSLEWVPDKGTTPKVGTTIVWGQGPGIGHLSLQEVDKADISKTASVTNAQVLDWELAGKYLGPGQSVRGWAFFQHPKGWIIPPGQDTTVKITDQSGTVFTYKIPQDNPEGNANGDVLPRTTTIGPITDLSRCSLER